MKCLERGVKASCPLKDSLEHCFILGNLWELERGEEIDTS
jgi:hypothetical protein